MCIRDRSQVVQNRRMKLIGQMAHIVRELGEPILDRAQFFACLLYTSDAADERSSVDLGGRRIIKKKKTVPVGGYLDRQ